MVIGVSGKIGSGKDLVGMIINYHLTGGMSSYVGETELEAFESFEEYYNDGIEYYPYQIKKYADKLKDMVCMLIGCTREDLENREFKEKPLGKEWEKINKFVRHEFVGSHEEYEKFLSDNFNNIVLSSINKSKPIQRGPDFIFDVLLKEKKEGFLTPRKMLQLLGTDCGRMIIHPNIWVNALFSDYREDNKNWIVTDVRFPNEVEAIKEHNGINIRVVRFSEKRRCTCGINEKEHFHLRDGVLYSAYRHPYVAYNEHESETALDFYRGFDYIIDNNGSKLDLIEQVKEILIKEKLLQ